MGGTMSAITGSGSGSATSSKQHSTAISRLVSKERIPPTSDFWHLDLTAVYITAEQLKNAALQDLLDPADAESFILNNPETHNLNSLLYVIMVELSKLPRDFDVPFPWLVNLVFLGRIFLSYFVSHLSSEQFKEMLQLTYSPEHKSEAVSVGVDDAPGGVLDHDVLEELGGNLPRGLITALIGVLVDVNLNSATTDIHLEIIKMLIVLFSTQLFGPVSVDGEDLFLQLIQEERLFDWHPLLVTRLFQLVVLRAPEETGAERKFTDPHHASQQTTSLFSSVLSFFWFPFQIYKYLFQVKTEDATLSDYAVHLLMILVHQRQVNNIQVEYSKIADESLEEEGSSRKTISFSRLYDAIAQSLSSDESSIVLLCSLLRFNPLFKTYLFAKSDLERIVLPLLEIIYSEYDLSCNKIYIILIILLILSEDDEFSKYAHTRKSIAYVSWSKEVILQNISLGSLMMFVILRATQSNLTRLKDPYLHSNCLAILSNLSVNGSHLHTSAAQRLVQLLAGLSKRFVLLSNATTQGDSEVQASSSETHESKDDENEELATFGDFIRLLLEILNSCLTDHNLVGNEDLIYCLLHDVKNLQVFRNHEKFWDLAENLCLIIGYFQECLDASKLSEYSIESVKEIIRKSSKFYEQPLSHTLHEISLSRFKYEELPDSEEFFLPYIWLNCLADGGIRWSKEKITLLQLPDNISLFEAEDEVEEFNPSSEIKSSG